MSTSKQVSQSIRVSRKTATILLAAHGLSRRKIAAEARVGRPTVTKVLRGYRDVSPEKQLAVLQTIARLCGCEVEELVMGRLAA